MRLHVCALAASIALAAGVAKAQYHPYGVPASLPAPLTAARFDDGEKHIEPAPVMPIPENDTPSYDPGMPQQGGVVYEGAGQAGCGCQDGGVVYEGMGPGGMGPGGMLGGGGYFGRSCWYGSLSALVMTRADDDAVWLNYDASNINSALLGTTSAGPRWQGGFQLMLGRRINCNTGVQMNYWTLNPTNSTATVTDPNAMVSSSMDFRSLNFTPTDPVNNWFNNAQAQFINRRSEFHSFAVNFVRFGNYNPCSRLSYSFLGGFRWFRFKDDFLYGTSENSTSFGVTPSEEAYYKIRNTNDLLGFQIGGLANYQATCRTSVYGGAKFGIYNNHIQHYNNIFTGTGVSAYRFADGVSANVATNRNSFATLAQLDVGAKYRLNCRWSAFLGYRLVAVTGVAVASQQIPYLQDDISGVRNINQRGCLILHGGLAGITCNY